MTYTTYGAEQTQHIARELAATVKGGDILLLSGELGAGKTTFVKGLASAFGIAEEDIVSPTFTLMNVHLIEVTTENLQSRRKVRDPVSEASGLRTLVHIDTYRLKNEQELIDIGVEDYLGAPDTLCVIEWPEKIKNLLEKKKVLSIHFEHTSENQRKILFSVPQNI